MFLDLLVLVLPYAAEAGVTLAKSAWSGAGSAWGAAKSALSGMAEAGNAFVGALPSDWSRWNGARPELRGAPDNTILDYNGLEKTSPEFRAALLDTAEALGLPVDSLAGIMSNESGFDPAALNPLPAAGLIQLTLGAKLPPFDTKEKILAITKMSPIDQLSAVVVPYYQRFGDKLRGANPGQIYMANFLPAEMNKPESTVLGTVPPELADKLSLKGADWSAALKAVREARKLPFVEAVYVENRGFDGAKKGSITIADVYQAVAARAKGAKGVRMRVDGSLVSPSGDAPPGAVASMDGAKQAPDAPKPAQLPPKPSTPAPSGGAGPRPPAASSGGITLAAVLDGTAVIPEMVNLTLPSGLTVLLMVDAISVPWEGSGFVRMPVSYNDTIAICNKLGCLPLTKEISDLAWKTCPVHLSPVPLVKTAADAAKMSTVEWSLKHDMNVIKPENNSTGQAVNFGAWQADVGKDWILDVGIAKKGAVNYGWRTLQGVPLQPVGAAHDANHYDYSQVCRLIQRQGFFEGKTVDLLERPDLWLPAGFPAALLAPFKG